MAPGPNWLTSWVKTNNKHVLFLPNASQGKHVDHDKTEHGSLTTASTTNSTKAGHRIEHVDPEPSTTVRPSNNRKQRRRLQKTRSASDLIREMAKDVEDGNAVRKIGPSRPKEDDHTRVATEPPVPVRSSSSSMRLVAGLFGSSISLSSDDDMPPPLSQQQQQAAVPMFLNEAAFIQQLEQRNQPNQQQIPNTESLHSRERPMYSVPHKEISHERAHSRGRETQPQQNHLGGLANLKFLPQQFFAAPNAETQQYPPRRHSLEDQLAAAVDDLDYMRGVALKNEHTCQSCSSNNNINSPSNKVGKSPTGSRAYGAHSSLVETSKQLNEVTCRQKKQIEQLTKERVRWQQDMHFKLNKFAGLCADLGEESANRNEKAIALKQDLDTVMTERDALSQEILLLRAQVQEQERERAEYGEMKRRLIEYESKGLDSATETIQSRDFVISELSSKLERTLDLLEIERAQRQRRQIIFPASARPGLSAHS